MVGGGGVPPETSDWEISADLPGKKRQGKKRGKGKGVKIEKKIRTILKGLVENWKWKVESYKMRRWPFFFFSFSFFKTTKICFGSTKMESFYREKALTPGGKKIRKKWLCTPGCLSLPSSLMKNMLHLYTRSLQTKILKYYFHGY